jgi:hypothetical protein
MVADMRLGNSLGLYIQVDWYDKALHLEQLDPDRHGSPIAASLTMSEARPTPANRTPIRCRELRGPMRRESLAVGVSFFVGPEVRKAVANAARHSCRSRIPMFGATSLVRSRKRATT